jgi:HPr kinase/phosphorylase
VRHHGVLVEIHGIGVLLLGPSGIGKSECALELIHRGHQLVADDVVELTRMPGGVIIGHPLESIQHHMEIRGLGILSVPDLFGPTAVSDEARVDLICRLEIPDHDHAYERVGIERGTEEVEGVAIPSVLLPSRPAGSMATVVEVAAGDQRLRARGINAAARLDARLREEMERK